MCRVVRVEGGAWVGGGERTGNPSLGVGLAQVRLVEVATVEVSAGMQCHRARALGCLCEMTAAIEQAMTSHTSETRAW
jgi:hypothetical protein